MIRQIILIAHNLRSAENVGSLLRTADGLGLTQVILTGYSPYPIMDNDPRLPHESAKVHNRIAKASLGAEKSAHWTHNDDINTMISELKQQGFTIAALEQAPASIPLQTYKPPEKVAVIVGRELEGLESEILQTADVIIEIPMSGQKESYNVAKLRLWPCITSAILLYPDDCV